MSLSHEQSGDRRRAGGIVGYVALVAVGLAIALVRFPPADLTGWLARVVGTTLGVPYLLVAVLFGAAAFLLDPRSSAQRTLRVVTFVLAGLAALLGLLLITTPA